MEERAGEREEFVSSLLRAFEKSCWNLCQSNCRQEEICVLFIYLKIFSHSKLVCHMFQVQMPSQGDKVSRQTSIKIAGELFLELALQLILKTNSADSIFEFLDVVTSFSS